MCYIDVDSYSEVWNERVVTARKEHRCDCCQGIIVPGAKYIRHFSIFEGEITSEKLCVDCDGDRQEFSKRHEYWTPSPGATRGLVKECLHAREDFSSMLLWARTLKRMEKRKLLTPPAKVGG